MHTNEDAPLKTLLYSPQAQLVQALVPANSVLYEPAAQAVHTFEEDAATKLPNFPTTQAVHTQDEDAVKMALYLPVPQAVHELAPTASVL